eukprot:6993473-Prymnesium_polylepis.1
MSDAVDGRSAARCRNTIVRQNVTFPQIPLTLCCGASGQRAAARGGLQHHCDRGAVHLRLIIALGKLLREI